MKKTLLVFLGLSAMASVQALPYKNAGTGALLNPETKPTHQTHINSLGQLSRDADWEFGAPIYDLPAGGEYKLYNRTSEMIYYTYNGLVMGNDEYFAGEVVFYDNGDVYLRNMIPSMLSGSYLKGTLQGNKISVDLPQSLCYDNPFYDDNGNLITDSVWPVFRGEYEISQYWDEEYEEYVGQIDVYVDPDCQTITFTINEDGSITQDDDKSVLGVFTQGEIWYGEAAWNYVYKPFDEQPQTMPEGLEIENWAFYDIYSSAMTQMAFDGDELYWRGMYNALPESVVKGRISGNKVIFDSPTYIGIDPATSHLAYFAGTEAINNRLTIVSNPRLSYDPEKREITYPRKYLIVNAGPEKVNLIAQFQSPTIHYQPDDVKYAAPVEPIIQWVSEFEYSEMVQMNCWFTVVDIPNIDVDGNLLDTDNMWFNFYFDNELYWFDAYDYGLVHDATDVPYDYQDDRNFYFMGNFQHFVYFYWTGFRTMGVQSVFEDKDGNVYKSAIAEYINPNAGIEALDSDKAPVAVIYYDLQGRPTLCPSGLCIKQSTYSDGSVRTQKVVVKQ